MHVASTLPVPTASLADVSDVTFDWSASCVALSISVELGDEPWVDCVVHVGRDGTVSLSECPDQHRKAVQSFLDDANARLAMRLIHKLASKRWESFDLYDADEI